MLALALLLAPAACRTRQAPSKAPPEAAPEPAPSPAMDAGPPPADAQTVHIIYPPAPGSFSQLTRDLGSAVVNIRTTGQVTGGPASMYPNARPDSSLGSGFIVDREAGYVLTNHHIVARSATLRVVLPGNDERAARLAGRAPHLDIALLQVAGAPLPESVRALGLGQSENLSVGEWVVALGNPFGGEVTASAGIVSSLGTTTSVYEPPQERFRSMIHTDAAIHPGNSGGPLVNLAGEVVGVSTAVSPNPSAIGFAVPISHIRRIFDELKKGRVAETWLGIFVLPVSEKTAGACALRGVQVTQVLPGSPAAKAGLRQGDIITRFDDRDVDAPKLQALSRTTVPGQNIPISICRDGTELARTLVAEEKPH